MYYENYFTFAIKCMLCFHCIKVNLHLLMGINIFVHKELVLADLQLLRLSPSVQSETFHQSSGALFLHL